MKKITFILLLAIGFTQFAFGQLTGTKTIPGDYPSVAAAITALNTSGVGAGGVIFNIATGYTETFGALNSGLITASGTSANPIVFQKNGAGVNPKITAATPGVAAMDYIFCLSGSDYVTFNGIDVQENASNTTAIMQMERGYALLKASATDGSQNVTIKNCTITLNKANTATCGIYSNNHTSAVITLLTVTAASGTNSTNKFFLNTISNSYTGIYINGYADAVSPYAYYDQNNEIGVGGVNTITNFGGGTVAAYGINTNYQNFSKIANNSINGGTGTTGAVYGIYSGTATSANVDIYGNSVTVISGGTTAAMYGIYNATGSTAASNTVNIYNNTIQNCTYTTATTAIIYLLYSTSTPFTVNIYGNIILNCSFPNTGALYGIYSSGSATNANIYSNEVGNLTKSVSGTMYALYGTTSIISVHDNNVHNLTMSAGANAMYGFYDLSSPTNENYFNNTFNNFTNLGTGGVFGIYTNTAAGTRNVYSNSIYAFNAAGGGPIYGIYGASSSPKIYKNRVYDMTSGAAGSLIYGIYLTSAVGVANIYNNFISDLKTPTATGLAAIAGIYIGGGTTVGVYYNTIYMNAVSTGTTFGTMGIYASTTPTVDLRNNIVVNLSTAGATGGYTTAYRRTSNTLTTYAATSNYNNFYAGIPAASNVIYYDGTTTQQTMAAYQILVSPRDAQSFTENPPFVNVATTPYDLHMKTTIPTQCESGGANIATYTTDFDGDIRQGNAGYIGTGNFPDIGADEFNGLPNFTCAAPVPGNTVSTANNICLGQSITLSMQNTITGTGNAYQWKSSPDNITYSDITGANSITLTLTPASSLYYKCTVTCTNGPVSATSNPLQITFTNAIASTTPATRCGTGSVNLQATTASPGAILNWYSASSGGTSLGSGSPFATPSISTNTTYYVAAETASPGNATVGAGSATSSTYPDPFYSLWSNTHNQYLITAAELAAAGIGPGNITSLSLNITAGTMAMMDFSIKMAHTAATNMSAFLAPAFTTVYIASTQTPVVGLNTMTFSTPFLWNGSSNIVIEICHGNASSSATMSSSCTVDNTSYVSVIHVHKSAASAGSLTCVDLTTNLTTYSIRPNFTFGGTVLCSSPRISVVATVNTPPSVTVNATPPTICSGQSSTLTATSSNTGYVYSWLPATTPATGSPVLATPVTTTTYTMTATDNSAGPYNGCSFVSTTTVNVNASPSALTVTPANSNINLGQIQQLTASGGIINNQVLLHENFNLSAPTWVITNGPTSPAVGAWHYEDCPFNIVSHAFTNFSTLDGGKFAFSNADAGGSGSTTVTMLTSPSFNTTGFTSLSLSFEQIYFQ